MKKAEKVDTAVIVTDKSNGWKHLLSSFDLVTAPMASPKISVIIKQIKFVTLLRLLDLSILVQGK